MARYRLQPCALMWGYFYRDHSHTARSPCVRAGKRPPLAYKASDYLRGHYQVRNLPRLVPARHPVHVRVCVPRRQSPPAPPAQNLHRSQTRFLPVATSAAA